ncbi:MAG: hypothetical protein HYS62_01235, partial [Candidatus Aenigmarchaeota archaeon]|nr:hypothetical protein [Candidatus Aenigmarchaeota archaeon]
MADERKIVDKLREMGFALQDDFSLGKKLKIQPVRIGMPGSREEGTAFGPPRRDTPYPIDNIRVLEEKGEYYVALFSSRAGSKPVTFRKIPVASLQPTPTIGASPTPTPRSQERALVPYRRNLPVPTVTPGPLAPTPSARAIVPTPTPGAPSPTTTPYPPVPTPMPTPSPSPSPSPTPEGYIIVIRLMTERGNPVTNVAVSLDGTTQTTNGSGNATFRNVSVGPHLITAPMTATVGGISYNFSNWQDDPGAGPSRQYNVQRSGILLGIYRSGG